MRPGIEQISKAEFYERGGFSNPSLFRKARRDGSWQYFRDHTHHAVKPAADYHRGGS